MPAALHTQGRDASPKARSGGGGSLPLTAGAESGRLEDRCRPGCEGWEGRRRPRLGTCPRSKPRRCKLGAYLGK